MAFLLCRQHGSCAQMFLGGWCWCLCEWLGSGVCDLWEDGEGITLPSLWTAEGSDKEERLERPGRGQNQFR